MMCFTMLAMPTIALGSPEAFQYNRAHSLFWAPQHAQSAALAVSGRSAALAVAELGSCASSGRAWQLRAGRDA